MVLAKCSVVNLFFSLQKMDEFVVNEIDEIRSS